MSMAAYGTMEKAVFVFDFSPSRFACSYNQT